MTEPAHDARDAAAARLRAAIEMFETGVEMMRQTLRRTNPAASEGEIEARLRTWLAERPGAPFGDALGRPVAWPRRRE
jgi:signal transduction histidine kinase